MIFKLAKYYLSLHYWNAASAASVRKMQVRRFREIFEYARQNSKFYKEFYSKNGVLNLKIESLDDIVKVPIIDKSIIRQYSSRDLMTCEIDDKINIHTTSGSTGEPFKVAFNKFEDYTGHVRVFWALRQAGYKITDNIVTVTRYEPDDLFDIEKDVSFITKIRNTLNLFQREIISIYEPAEAIISKLLKTKARVLWSTPSVMQTIAKKLQEKDIKLRFPIVFLTGEPITEMQKVQFSTYVGNYIVSLYGALESPSLGFDFGLTDRFALFPNSNLFQFENINKNENGEKTGTVIISNLINMTMPILRYNLNDFTIMDVQPDFGIKYLNRITGRQDDILDLGNGQELAHHQVFAMFLDFYECEKFKIIQLPDKSLILQLIPAPGIAKTEIERLALQRWRKRYETIPLIIEFVDHFEINPYTGKSKMMERL